MSAPVYDRDGVNRLPAWRPRFQGHDIFNVKSKMVQDRAIVTTADQ